MTALQVGSARASGLRWPNSVNGRLLTADDLNTMIDAVFTRDRLLGTAIGAGVVVGFEVTGATGDTSLGLARGVGVNRAGTAFQLDSPASLDLTVVGSDAPPDGSRFADCRPPSPTTKAPTAGAYLLTVAPQTWYEGKVPVQGSPTNPLPTPCVSRWEVEGAVFTAIRLDSFDSTATTPADRRNLLAHWCFGTAALGPLAMGGFLGGAYRGIDQLPAAELDDCQLPLAVFDWDGAAPPLKVTRGLNPLATGADGRPPGYREFGPPRVRGI